MIKTDTQKIERMGAFDLARGLAILFMVLIHVLIFYGQPQVQDNLFGILIEALGSWPAAPVFVFIMGVFITYTKHNNLQKGLRRAVYLFMLGYLLNLARGSLPMWLSLEMGLVSYQQLGGYTPLTELLIVDVLQFAGLAYAICLLSQRMIAEPRIWVFIAIIIAFMSPWLWDIKTDSWIVNQVLKLFIGHPDNGAMFPLLPWLSYPFIGMAFGYWLKQSADKTRLFKQSFFAGTILMISGGLLALSNINYHFGDIMRSGPGAILMSSGFVLSWLGICHFMVIKIPANPVFNLLYFWSNQVTKLYIVQWLFIGWGLMMLGSQQLSFSQTVAAMLVMLLLSDLGTRFWVFKSQRKLTVQTQ